MKAGLDVVLFFVTVYDYFFGVKDPAEDGPQPDIPTQRMDDETGSLSGYMSYDGY